MLIAGEVFPSERTGMNPQGGLLYAEQKGNGTTVEMEVYSSTQIQV